MDLIDTHAHLDFPTSLSSGELRGASTDDTEEVLKRAKGASVSKIICVGTSVEASRRCVEIAEQRTTGTQIYATLGIHAQDGKKDIQKYGSLEKCIDELRKIVNRSRNKFGMTKNKFGMTKSVQNDNVGRVVGVGECGFDVHVTGNTRQVTSDRGKKFQKELFEAQIGLARELNLPLVIHCRNAFDETFELLSGQNPELTQQGSALNLRGVFHSWTGDWEAAQRALGLGFYISFSGIVTFGNAPNVQEVAAKITLERMLLETDSPFLAPHPLRGSPNEPKNVKIIAEFIAQLRNLPVERIAEITSRNAGRLFGI